MITTKPRTRRNDPTASTTLRTIGFDQGGFEGITSVPLAVPRSRKMALSKDYFVNDENMLIEKIKNTIEQQTN